MTTEALLLGSTSGEPPWGGCASLEVGQGPRVGPCCAAAASLPGPVVISAVSRAPLALLLLLLLSLLLVFLSFSSLLLLLLLLVLLLPAAPKCHQNLYRVLLPAAPEIH